MPAYEIALPVGARDIQLELADGTRIPIFPSYHRSSKDGHIPIVALLSGDAFVGDVLEGHWRPWESVKATTHLAVSNKRVIYTSGAAHVGAGYSSLAFIPIGSTIEFDLGTDETTAGSSASHQEAFFGLGGPYRGYWVRVQHDVDKLRVVHGWDRPWHVVGAVAEGGYPGLFRIKIEFTKGSIKLYVDGALKAELGNEAGPFAQPWISIWATHAARRTSYMQNLKVTLPNLKVLFDVALEDVGKGDVKVYDTLGEADEGKWQRVFSPSHVFKGDCVVENGITRVVLEKLGQWRDSPVLRAYHWGGAAWSINLELLNENWRPTLVVLKKIEELTPERAVALVYLRNDQDRESLNRLVVSRGAPVRWECLGPRARQIWHHYHAEFGFCNDVGGHKWVDEIHYVLGGDNWGICTDGAGARATLWGSRDNVWVFDSVVPHIYHGQWKIFACRPIDWPFLKQAEAATIGPGASVDTGLEDDLGDSVALDARGEYVSWILTAPAGGRYKLFIRVKQSGDPSAITNDLRVSVRNITDNRRIELPPGDRIFTPGTAFGYVYVNFEIGPGEAGDQIELRAEKATAAANTIWVDFFCVVPVCNGKDWPQDLAHNAMRDVRMKFTIVPR